MLLRSVPGLPKAGVNLLAMQGITTLEEALLRISEIREMRGVGPKFLSYLREQVAQERGSVDPKEVVMCANVLALKAPRLSEKQRSRIAHYAVLAGWRSTTAA